jgi:hemoglobin
MADTLYDVLGEQSLRRLVDRFYDVMDTDPEAATIRAMHPPDLATSREKLLFFLSGFLGGPPLYWDKYGHPKLRFRHLPFSIGDAEAAAWMRCMRVALDEVVTHPELKIVLEGEFDRVAQHMRNRE